MSLYPGCNAAFFLNLQDIIKQNQKIQTVSKITNQVQRSKRNKNIVATRYNGTKCPENKLQKIQTHTGGLSENGSRLQSPGRHHFGDWQGYSEALGDAPSHMKTHHVAHGWRLELYIRATLFHCQFCATHLFEDVRVC